MSTVYTLLRSVYPQLPLPACGLTNNRAQEIIATSVADLLSHAQAEQANRANHAASIICRDGRVVYRSGRVSGRE
jgi:hypothetical protein